MERRIGVVRKWVEDRGFGFLKVLEKRDDGKPARVDSSLPDVFFHIKELKRAGIEKVEVGDTLEFDIKHYPKGFVASKVALVQ
jgi:cold shock CspA family protein